MLGSRSLFADNDLALEGENRRVPPSALPPRYLAELTGKLEALEALLARSEFAKHFEDLKIQIKVLYEVMRERNLLLTTVPENSAASIYATRKDGRYTYLNHEMEVLCNVVREQVLGKTDFEVFSGRSLSSGEPTTSRL